MERRNLANVHAAARIGYTVARKEIEGHMTPSLLEAEIFSQPDAIRAVITQSSASATIAAHIHAGDPYSVMIAARGTSDNAARFAQYLFGMMLRLPVGLATPSLATLYGTDLHFRRALVLGISQSGRSPDICEYVASARRQSALTLAITNVPSSPLAQAAEYHLDIAAGVEQSVAATKTYTNQLATVALLAGHLAGDGRFIEVQGTAEGVPFDRNLLDSLLDLAVAGCVELGEIQKAALAK
jgi:glucosamine--fructose-6-phosphate aminotransferase (isomerizing)